MKKLQHWFEVLAGVPQDHLDRIHLARHIYAAPAPDLSRLDTPACWRRPRRVRIAGY